MEIIEFAKPVTLIVGSNGSGKTTIIECLKMACCGILPPNSRNGHGFIHDPQVAHLPEVKAQIRMLFKAPAASKDKEICAIRSFQLTNKRVNGRVRPQYKALDSVLRTTADDGAKASISHRCADMDAQVPELMGVSRAILENVIFCHQEESSWPLQDPREVKKRFDDIFGATRYTKALENIRSLQREWAKVTRDRRADADLTQAHLNQAAKLREQRDERSRVAEEITEEVKELDTHIANANEGLQRLEIELAQFESRGHRVVELKSVLARMQEEEANIRRTMEERRQDVYRESLEELQEQAQNFREKVLCESEQKVRMAKQAVTTGEAEYRSAVDAAQKLREEMGETVAAAEMLASRKSELSERLQKAQQPSVAALKAKLDAVAADFSRVEREQRQRDAASEEALVAAERALREASLEASRNESRAEDAAEGVKRLEQEAKTLSSATPQLDQLVRQMRENEATLGAEGSEARLQRLDAKQEEIGRRRHDLQYSITRKSSEVVQLEAQSDAHVEVDALRRRLHEAEAELSNKLGELRPRFVGVLGQAPEPADAEARVSAEFQQTEEQLKRKRKTVQDAQQKSSGFSGRRAATEAELRRIQAEEGRLSSELGVPAMTLSGGGASLSAASDFTSRLSAQREQVELARKDLAMTESAQHMYEKFREKSRAKNACQFCRRSFGCTADLTAFEDTVERLIVKIPAFLEESRRRLREAQEELTRLDGQRPRWDRLEQFREIDIPQKQKDLAMIAEEERAAQQGLEPEERDLRKLEERSRQLQDLRADAAALQRGARNSEELRAGVRAKEARLLGANSKVSLQAERDQLRSLQEQLAELGREEDTVRTQRDVLAKQQQQLRTVLAEQKGRLQLLQAQVARSGDVGSELAARQADLREHTDVAKRARAAATTSEKRVHELREERANLDARFRRERETRDVEVRSLQREVDSLTELERSIEVMRGRVENAEVLKTRMAAGDEAARVAQRELDGLRQRLESEEEKRRKREEVRVCLEANLHLKKLEVDMRRSESELAELIRDLGGRDLSALRHSLEDQRQISVDLQKRRSFKDGELKNTRETVKGLEVELSGPLYAGVEQRHREAIIKHESAAYASRDLSRYHGALDRALMKFHTMKISEINRTLRELWQRIYRGRDIDFIAVRSDTEESEETAGLSGAAAGAQAETGRALRSYNYRVVMVCGEAEMDMRGRCSAGQRVLASLLIRLALSESFCVNCGILALDEPTTNLDASNIRGLAEAFASLIDARRRHAHFELILITHDDQFVNHLCQLQVCDWYYNIRKDEQGCSKVDRKDIRLLG